VVVNATTAALFFHGRKGDLNIRAAFLHMAAAETVWSPIPSRSGRTWNPSWRSRKREDHHLRVHS
jgi:hypothetical protein